jgi:hypothetical protein
MSTANEKISTGIAVVGVVAGAVLSRLLALKTWTLKNQDTGETIQGQFPAEEVALDGTGSNFVQIPALNRANAIIQFINGKTPTLSVSSRFYRRDFTDDPPVDKIEKLRQWATMDALAASAGIRLRPPLLTFYLGDGLGLQMDCFMTDCTSIKYSEPNALGGMRQVTFEMKFLRVSGGQTASLDEKEVLDTRYFHCKSDDYYEKICELEYGDPMIGVVIRQRNPTKALLKTGDIIALPAAAGVSGSTPNQQSIPLSGAFGRKNTITKQLRIQYFNTRNRPYTAFVR